ncbi:response regulator [Streptomyces albogriseolus]|uniref:DNA-binding NarL/FixJ family response regulator n=1 Tax=Streptomyces albogriseolus TaxID=1887 RepID=A0ACC6URM9_STRAO|nr:response regulator transcription factor [Streptomyces viridodiastaticus]MCX4568928.1 response regulator transcription factor [Streptomyces viridodiastaticus]
MSGEPDPFGEVPPPEPLRLVVADDNPVVRAGLTALLSGREDLEVVAEAADGREAYEATLAHLPDVVLLDVRMPGVDGLTALPHLVPLTAVLMLTYSGESDIVHEALRRGANGYLVHGEFTPDELVTAVRDARRGRPHLTPTAAGRLLAQLRAGGAGDSASGAASGRSWLNAGPTSTENLSQLQPGMAQSVSDRSTYGLSAREAEIMELIASGMSNQQIAATCFISEKTVKNHINRIFAKLHSTSRSEATAKWLGTRRGPARDGGDRW